MYVDESHLIVVLPVPLAISTTDVAVVMSAVDRIPSVHDNASELALDADARA
jgi:hypothetical protein